MTEFIGVKILAALLGVGLGAFIGRASVAAMVLSALVGGVLLSFGPDLYIGYAARKRIKSFNNQLGDGITLMANSLRSGYSFLQSMDLVSREAPPPMSSEFRRVVQQSWPGALDRALGNLMRRVPSDDLDLLITAVNIQHEVGGDLAQILETIGHTIRERATDQRRDPGAHGSGPHLGVCDHGPADLAGGWDYADQPRLYGADV